MPTPLVKIKEILRLNQKLKDFKKSFTDNLINVLAAEGVHIKIKGDDLIYHRKHRSMIAEKSGQPGSQNTEPKQINLERFNFEELKLNKSFVIALCKIYSEDNVVKALEKMQYIKKKQEIKNPAGFLKAMLADGTYEDAAEIKDRHELRKSELVEKRKSKEIENTLDELTEEIYANMDPAERNKKICELGKEFSGPEELKEGLAALRLKAQIRESIAVKGK
jgi:hypothetical protein